MSIIEKAVARLEKSPGAQRGKANSPQDDKVRPGNEYKHSSRSVCKFDYGALRQSGYLVDKDGASRIAEQYRRIKRPLLKNVFSMDAKTHETPPNVMVVTSARAGEGKTFNSLNLALAFAQEKDLNVLLIDGDVVRGQLSRLLGLENERGLTDLLDSDYTNMLGTIVDTSIEGLHVLPAGKVDDFSTELLSSKRMRQFLRELLRVYSDSLIIFDAPPLLSASQANVLCELAGQIVLIVEAGKTSEASVKEAVLMLDQSKPIGVVLNKDTRSQNTYYDNYSTNE